MIEIQAPTKLPARADVFLAGGILNADNWQPKALTLLSDTSGFALNPRRKEPFHGNMQQEQVEWEHYALRSADAILFWFPPETLCPITLFELGVWSVAQVPVYTGTNHFRKFFDRRTKNIPIFVGTHPDYQRRGDIEIQLGLSRPEVFIHDNLADTVADYVKYLNSKNSKAKR